MHRIGVLVTTFVALYIATAFICADWYWAQTILSSGDLFIRLWITVVYVYVLSMAWLFSGD